MHQVNFTACYTYLLRNKPVFVCVNLVKVGAAIAAGDVRIQSETAKRRNDGCGRQMLSRCCVWPVPHTVELWWRRD